MSTLSQTSKRQAKRLLQRALHAYAGAPPRIDPARWALSARPRQGLLLEGRALHGLLAEWGSPLHVVHAEKLHANAQAFMATPAGARTRCEVYYSYKTNPIPGVLSLLHGLGVGAEVISHYEFWLARRLGVPPDKIVYNGPAKSDESIREAVQAGVQTLNVNHREEIARVARIAAEVGKKLRVGIRVSVGSGWSFQFGTPVAGGDALEAYRQALASPWLSVVGLHAHRGGMVRSEHELTSFVAGVLDFADSLRRELGLELEILNFGGSLGTPTVEHLSALDQRLNQTLFRDLPIPDADAALSIERYLALLVEQVEARYRAHGRALPRVFLEPGRGMTGNTQMLLATVLSTKRAEGASFAILDAGINHAECVRNEYHQLLPVNRFGERGEHTYTVVGPICSPGDTLYRAARLPALRAGDSLAIMDAGAYFVPFATSFSFPQPAIVMLERGQVRLLRRAERFEDLVLCDELP